jgi:hypothetical protein
MRRKDASEERGSGQVVAFRRLRGKLSYALVEVDDA